MTTSTNAATHAAPDDRPTLVTGGNGYLGAWLTSTLLASGTTVRATLRSPDREAHLREAVARAGVDDARLEIAFAGLTSDDGWDEAVSGCGTVHHVATPMIQPTDPVEVVVPARDGALRVLRAARDAGVRRVVLTSSFAAVGYSPKPVRDYTEDDWTDPETPGLPAYPLAKTIAERAAWDFVAQEGGDLELVSLNPTFILGPILTPEARSSLGLVKGLLDGQLHVVPRQRFGVVDVRDVADAHVRAMDTPAASGRRYLLLADGPTVTYLALAHTLRDQPGGLGHRVVAEEAPGEEPTPLTIRNDRAKAELGFAPRPLATTLMETAESLRDLGLLD
jgi:nucleoside-diphosphate-sugar epimerase